jgi:hypothetical protein
MAALLFAVIDVGGRLGARARVANSTEEQRREWARNAANARWGKANP